jgi:hypothetical protein
MDHDGNFMTWAHVDGFRWIDLDGYLSSWTGDYDQSLGNYSERMDNSKGINTWWVLEANYQIQ